MTARVLLAAITLLTCAFTHAGTATTDYSDIWWNSAASGEGFTVTHSSNTIFMTFFTYRPTDGAQAWYVVTMVPAGGGYTGTLFTTTCCPPAVGARAVGNASFVPSGWSSATLTYSIDGVTLSKSLTRQPLANPSVSGSYVGGTIGTYSGACPLTGYAEEPANVVITQSGTNVVISTSSTATSCTYNATYTNAGRLGSLAGNFSCTSGASGSFQATEVDVNPQGITGRATSSSAGCSWAGRFGGLRRGS